MMRTSGFSPTDSTARSSADAAPPSGLVCAVHQPNFLPRLSTVAKLAAADVWVVLDDVQFSRRDYQHRARVAPVDGSRPTRWLSVPTHLPSGRATLIRDARLVEIPRSVRRVEHVLRQHYGVSPYWPLLATDLPGLLTLFRSTDRMAEIAEASTLLLLRFLGWSGTVVRSSALSAGSGRTQRLVDLCLAVGADTYLCGTGGSRYIEPDPFTAERVELRQFGVPTTGVWAGARQVSALHSLMVHGPEVVKAVLEVG
ncbi:WbqC family protein [Kitasatospora sp. NPDC056783]|uniref:WbqC family protein n=1 Tax=Kitasatospora sp. NPDC056783 TaxID=3345943 RepID=UPI0036BF9AF0